MQEQHLCIKLLNFLYTSLLFYVSMFETFHRSCLIFKMSSNNFYCAQIITIHFYCIFITKYFSKIRTPTHILYWFPTLFYWDIIILSPIMIYIIWLWNIPTYKWIENIYIILQLFPRSGAHKIQDFLNIFCLPCQISVCMPCVLYSNLFSYPFTSLNVNFMPRRNDEQTIKCLFIY